MNYDLHNQAPVNFLSFIESRIDQLDLKKAPRHDAVYMCGLIVSASPEFFAGLSVDETSRFFEESYKYLAGQVGSENVISASVHMDEQTPHMHFTHVPITDDGRLNANAIYTRNTLRQLQSDFPQVLRKHGFEIERGVEQVPGASKVHLNTREYKQQTEAMKQAAGEVEKLNQELTVIADKLTHSLEDEKQLAERLAMYEAMAKEAEDIIEGHVDPLPAPKMLNAKEIHAAALEIIDLQKKALADIVRANEKRDAMHPEKWRTCAYANAAFF